MINILKKVVYWLGFAALAKAALTVFVEGYEAMQPNTKTNEPS